MKKIILFLTVTAALLAFFACGNKNDEDYFYNINLLIKDEDFYIARPENGKIILYNSEDEPTGEIAADEYGGEAKFIYARKDGARIFFVTAAAIDDEDGIVFINDDSNNVLDGVKRMERIGGNSYKYSTMN